MEYTKYAWLSNLAYENNDIVQFVYSKFIDRDPITQDDLNKCPNIKEYIKSFSNLLSEPIHIVGNGCDIQAYILFFDDYTIVTFKGTHDIFELFSDLDYIQIKYENMNVHKGFLKYYKSLNIHPYLKNEKQIIMTGHSLGGAISQLAALKYKCKCITFGVPRVGNEEWAEEFNKYVNNTSFINNEDPIPYYPPFTNYYIVKNQKYIIKKHIYDKPIYSLKKITKDFLLSFIGYKRDPIIDHLLLNYINQLSSTSSNSLFSSFW